MKVLNAKVSNFGSYKELSYDFTSDSGLIIIGGPTGSGKSTFCDIIPWVLFGKTAKGGTVDEVLSWPGNSMCQGTVVVDLGFTSLYVNRTRKPNDLHYYLDGAWEHPRRGKDLNDTQKLINKIIGLDFELYLAAGYYHEFSQTAQFFITTPKNRRTICEQLVDLTLATKLQANTKDAVKTNEQHIYNSMQNIHSLNAEIAVYKRLETSEVEKYKNWEDIRQRSLKSYTLQYEQFEKGRTKVVSHQCKACGTVLKEPKEVHDASENPYTERLLSLEVEKNPHTEGVKDFSKDIKAKELELVTITTILEKHNNDRFNLGEMQGILDQFRSQSIVNTIKYVEQQTNEFLSTFFDAEIRVEFDVEVADKLEVTIHKDGNVASFTQLSKGQRQLLKLCFGISVMKTVQNRHGISLNQLYFDEATDGLDENMKLKALKMLETLTLEYQAVFLVEHSEKLKAFANNVYQVELVNGESQFGKA